LKEALVSALVI
jgi:hypothetical protein